MGVVVNLFQRVNCIGKKNILVHNKEYRKRVKIGNKAVSRIAIAPTVFMTAERMETAKIVSMQESCAYKV